MRKNMFESLHFPSSEISWILFSKHWSCRTNFYVWIKYNL